MMYDVNLRTLQLFCSVRNYKSLDSDRLAANYFEFFGSFNVSSEIACKQSTAQRYRISGNTWSGYGHYQFFHILFLSFNCAVISKISESLRNYYVYN